MSVRRDEIMVRVAERVEQMKPLGARDIERAERLLGIALPADLRDLYLTCGNGGFGPGVRALVDEDDEQALLELPPPRADRAEQSEWDGKWGHWEDWSVVRITQVFQNWAADTEDQEPPGLYRFFAWGCAIESCVDTLDPSLRVVRFDPHFGLDPEELAGGTDVPVRFAGVVPLYAPPVVAAVNRCCYHLESTSLLEWLDVWLEGHEPAVLQGMEPQRRRWRT